MLWNLNYNNNSFQTFIPRKENLYTSLSCKKKEKKLYEYKNLLHPYSYNNIPFI